MKRAARLKVAAALLVICGAGSFVGWPAPGQQAAAGPIVRAVVYRPWVRPYYYRPYVYRPYVYRPYVYARPAYVYPVPYYYAPYYVPY